MKPSWKARALHGLDRLLEPRSDPAVHATLSPFLDVLRRLRSLTNAFGPKAPTAQRMRERLRQDMVALRVGFEVGNVREVFMDTEAGSLPARLYEPRVKDADASLLLYFHGGGFIMGDLDTHDDACRLLCEESRMPVLSVAYRLAPEHPYPAATDDALAAVTWAHARLTSFGATGLVLGGDSAGANLAAVTAICCARSGLSVRAQLLIYPGTDRTTSRPSHRQFGKGYFLDAAERELFYRSYLGNRWELAAHWRVRPLLAELPASLAPALVVTGGHDMLRDEGIAYARHLQKHGISVQLQHFAHLGHGFVNLVSVHRGSRAAGEQVAQQWRALCLSNSSKGRCHAA